jgi:excisionase family DNA binding protein
MDTPRLYTTGEAAKVLGTNYKTVVRWANQGRLGEYSTTIGGHRRLDADRIDALAAETGTVRPATAGPLAGDGS